MVSVAILPSVVVSHELIVSYERSGRKRRYSRLLWDLFGAHVKQERSHYSARYRQSMARSTGVVMVVPAFNIILILTRVL